MVQISELYLHRADHMWSAFCYMVNTYSHFNLKRLSEENEYVTENII